MKTSPKISIESLDVKGNDVVVTYTANDELFERVISLSVLRQFAKDMELNVDYNDYVSFGELVQETVVLDLDTWLYENIEYAALLWLRVYHVVNPFEAITNKLGELIEELNK